jgi:hypothetical protein
MQLQSPEDDADFIPISDDEAAKAFADRVQDLGGENFAAIRDCGRCGKEVVAINQPPDIYTLNICYPDGQIFATVPICSNCVYEVLQCR